MDRGTLRKYLAPAEAAGITPGGPPMLAEADWRQLVAEWFPQVVDTTVRATTWPQIAEHRDYILGQLGQGVTQATIHQRLRDEHGLAASYASLKRWVAANLPEEAVRSRVSVPRPDVPAGHEAQIDYGRLGMWTDPATGKRRRVDAFVMVLACSRHMFVFPVLRMHQAAWTAAHLAAFDFFSGVPERVRQRFGGFLRVSAPRPRTARHQALGLLDRVENRGEPAHRLMKYVGVITTRTGTVAVMSR